VATGAREVDFGRGSRQSPVLGERDEGLKEKTTVRGLNTHGPTSSRTLFGSTGYCPGLPDIIRVGRTLSSRNSLSGRKCRTEIFREFLKI
jgi:hypothetical protein